MAVNRLSANFLICLILLSRDFDDSSRFPYGKASLLIHGIAIWVLPVSLSNNFKGALSHFRILLSILLIILNNLQVIQVLAAK